MTLNLVKKELSDIDYKIFTFPDGEIQIELLSDIKDSIVDIECRITCANDLFILLQVCDILKRMEILFSIEIYYFMGMRMDRVMSINRPYTLKLLHTIIENLNPVYFHILHPHSRKYYINESSEAYLITFLRTYLKQNTCVVFPDQGAVNRYTSFFNNYFPNTRFIAAEKVRELSTGKILYYDIVQDTNDTFNELLVLDDLCDGGNTFRLLANSLRNKYPDKKLRIFVTHMVNPKGIETLSEYYDEVYFTNSYKDWDNLPDNVTMIDLWKN